MLHDVDDFYRLDAVGVYEARYGTFHTWPLEHLLGSLAGQRVELRSERQRWRQLLVGDGTSTPAPGVGQVELSW